MRQNFVSTEDGILDKKLAAFKKAFQRWLNGDSPGHSNVAPYVGTTRENVRQWISDRFISGMDWSNYGNVWVVVHIVPLRFFDFSNDDDLKIGLYYKNLTPIFKQEIHFKENSVDLSLKILEDIPVCEVTKKLKAILLIEFGKSNKYILNGDKAEFIYLNSIYFEMTKGVRGRLSKKYQILSGNKRSLTVIEDGHDKKITRDVNIKQINMPIIRVEKNIIYVNMWSFSNEINDSNHNRIQNVLNNELKKRNFNIPK